jgi:DNA topoisomerase-1
MFEGPTRGRLPEKGRRSIMGHPGGDGSQAAVLSDQAADDAHSVGLHYVSDLSSGIRRLRAGKGFRYQDSKGRAVRDRAELERIRALVIPPAWNDVWICASPHGHIQAVGRDARRRKQYRYHSRWCAVRDETKYGQLVAFARALPALRRRVRRDLARPGLPREKVLATVVWLLETTMVRIGNEEYARTNQSFGLTTMRNRHVNVSGHTLLFQFRGKSGKQHRVQVIDRRVARIVKACQDIPGYELFQYLDEQGEAQTIDSADVNGYLREIAATDCSAKVFRTWAGTLQTLVALDSRRTCHSAAERRRELSEVIREVATSLGNTPAVCRKCYVHPAVIEGFEADTLHATLDGLARRPRGGRGLSAAERLTLAFLLERQRRPANALGSSRARSKPSARPRLLVRRARARGPRSRDR